MDHWRWHSPSCFSNSANEPSKDDLDVFQLKAGERWKYDDPHQERCEWAGPTSQSGFEIELVYALDEALPITDPKLTIFQIHSNTISQTGERTTLQPIVMVNLRCDRGNSHPSGVPRSHSDSFVQIGFRDPYHREDRPADYTRPDLGEGHGNAGPMDAFTLKACNVIDSETRKLIVEICITCDGYTETCKKFELPEPSQDIPEGFSLEVYPKFGAYRSDAPEKQGFTNTERPDQTVRAKLIRFNRY